jgi:hypothetical protein
MSKIKMISATALSAAVLLVSASSVQAQVVDQDQAVSVENDLHLSCTSGAYGQNLNCTADASGSATGTQSQFVNLGGDQRVVYRTDGTPVLVHDTVNTALDFKTMAVAFSTMLSGAAGVVVKIKSRA